MATLIADRFLFHGTATAAEDFNLMAIDLASGHRVRLQIASAGTRSEQQTWVDGCARAYADGRLVDFGFIGTAHRFEAYARPGAREGQPTPAAASLLEWLERAHPASPRVLYVAQRPDVRDLRLRGFVPCDVALLQDVALSSDIRAMLTKRSVVLLDSRGVPSHIALAVLRLRQSNVRDVCAVVQREPATPARIASAAESRAAYDGPASPPLDSRPERPEQDRRTKRQGREGGRLPMPDARVAQLMAEAERMLQRGRHSAAQRALRAALGASGRRGDWVRAGDIGLTLGRLLLGRGRAAEAKTVFEEAHSCFQQGLAPGPAIDATILLGVAQTDLADLRGAEQTCRAAYAAAVALQRPEFVLSAGIALARTLLWQERRADAWSLLEGITPAGDADTCTRYWCLVARLRIDSGALSDAWEPVERARRAANGGSPGLESLIRLCEARVQARLGDVEALRLHVAAGLAAARCAHLPLQAIRLRLVHVDGLVRAQRPGSARSSVKHLGAIRQGAVPPLLKSRIDSVLKTLDSPPTARESVARFQVEGSGCDVAELDGVRNLLALSHQLEDEAEALVRVATAVRRHTHAAGVGIFGSHSAVTRLVGASGSSSEQLAQRAINVGQPVVPGPAGGWMEGAIPIQYLGRFIGAMAFRWNIEGPRNLERALAFGAAAAAVCAPLVYVLLERQNTPASEEAPFDLTGASAAIGEVRKAIARAANAPFTVLIEGESGSGKELVARAIHRAGGRRDRRFAALNCAAMPEDLIDAELFGHAKGAFTGAAGERLGLFESADGGTVFLDEVGELSARAQAKVLRVLQEGEIRRVGENFTRPFDARLVAATNRSLRAEVEAGRFRQDLLYRLDVIRISVPPLRDRVDDIPLLAARFWKHAAERIGSKAVLGQSVLSALARYDWPGNVRELQNVLTALVVAVPARGVVGASQIPLAIARAAEASSQESLESARLKFEQRFVRAALARTAGHRGRTAAALGLSRQGLAKLMQRLHLDA